MKRDYAGWLSRAVWIAWGGLFAAHLLTLGRAPAGLHYDESFNALDALRIGYDGYWPAFLRDNFGREPLMVYVMAASLRLFGNHIWAVRFPAALAWGASLPALHWLIRELYPSDPRRRMVRWLIAAPLFMTSLWFGITAHYAIRTSWFVLMEMLFVAALWRLWNTGNTRTAVLAGVLGGLCSYTYLPNRLLPLLLGAFLLIGLARRRAQLLARWRVLAIVVLVAFVVQLPLAVHFARFPDDFGLRTSQVSIVDPAGEAADTSWLAALLDNGKRVAGMFFLRGDENPRNNVPGRPLLTWWILPLFLVGFLSLIWPRRSVRRLFILMWFLIMLLPTWLTELAPSYQRALGAFPPLILLVAEGGYTLWRQVQSASTGPTGWRTRHSWGRWATATIAALLLLTVLAESSASLSAFRQWTAMPSLFYAFDEGLTQLGQYMASLPSERLVYLSPVSGHPTLTFFLTAAPAPPDVRTFDGRHVLVSRPGEDLTYVVIVHEDYRFELMAPWLYPELDPPSEKFYDREGHTYAQVYRVPGTARLREPQFPTDIRWEDNVHLTAYDLIGCCTYKPGDTIFLELGWAVGSAPPQQPWTIFTHLLAPDGHLVAGDDCEPGCGSYPTTRWQPGDVIVDEYQLLIPADAPPGEYTLEIGLYDWRTGNRLSLIGHGGNSATLVPITVATP